MACYHPLKAFPIGFHPSGKTKYMICEYSVDHVELLSGQWISCSSPERGSYSDRVVRDFTEIPCGHCIGCRLEYSRQWANRCLLEMQYHEQSWFVTLTYDDQHVPRRYYGAPDTGVAFPSLTVCRRDVQLFLKRLRKAIEPQTIRFFGCAEYGPVTKRPHYHLILFGLKLPDDDLTFSAKSKSGHPIYKSKLLERVWSFPPRGDLGEESYSHQVDQESSLAGFVTVQPVTWECCAYTARYITKKLTGPAAEFYETFNIDSPFSMMSRKPGIARQYYDDHPDLYEHEYINVSTPTGGKKFRPPRYYDKLFDIEYPERSAELRATRQKMAEFQKAAKMERTDLSYLDYLSVEEQALNSRIKSLKREAN